MEPTALDEIIRSNDLDPQRVCMVGDRLDTDVALGKACGTKTLLVLSGVATMEEAEGASEGAAPDFVAPSVASIFA